MIELTQINGEIFYLNPDLIEIVQGTQGSIITLTTKKKIVVKETPVEIRKLFIKYKQNVYGKYRENKITRVLHGSR